MKKYLLIYFLFKIIDYRTVYTAYVTKQINKRIFTLTTVIELKISVTNMNLTSRNVILQINWKMLSIINGHINW